MIKAILAVGENGEIGQNGDMPWGRGLPKDLEYFKEVTEYQNVTMGRKTFFGLPFQHGLPLRDNWVITDQSVKYDDMYSCNGKTFDTYFVDCNYVKDFMKVGWVIGGKSIYEQLEYMVDEWHITRVKASFPEADTFFEPDLTGFEKVGVDKDVSGEYDAFVEVWRRVK